MSYRTITLMSGPRRQLCRIEDPSHARYLTCSCYRRLALFGNDRIKDAFAQRLAFVRIEMSFELYAWVLMPDHFHLLMRPGPAGDVTRVLRRLKARFARLVLGRWTELDAPILARLRDADDRLRFWQPGGGYDRNITSADELHEKIGYIHANPVRRGLAARPVDWRWSSARWHEQRCSETVPMDPLP